MVGSSAGLSQLTNRGRLGVNGAEQGEGEEGTNTKQQGAFEQFVDLGLHDVSFLVWVVGWLAACCSEAIMR